MTEYNLNVLKNRTAKVKAKRLKSPDLATQYWEEFTQVAIDKGYTKKVKGDLAFMNKKGKCIKLISTVGGILSYVDETQNNKVFQVYRKVE